MKPSSPPSRIQRLLNRFLPTGKEKTWYPNGADERAVLLWQYFKTAGEQPLPLRYAGGLAHVLRHIPITIHEDELIVGEVGLGDATLAGTSDLTAASAFWQRRNDTFQRSFSWYEAAHQAGVYGLSGKWANRDGHAIPDFALILEKGLAGLAHLARQAAASSDPAASDAHQHQVYWQAMQVALQALSDYIRRYAVLARRMSAEGTRPERRQELLEIAQRCEWLAEKPPRDLLEALQLVWFAHIGTRVDDGGIGHSFGRFDQYLAPFFHAGLDEDAVREMLACFWIKLNRESDDIAHLSLGGQTPQGEDAANRLSFLCLEVERWVSRKQPNLSTRVSRHTSPDYWREIAATLACRAGHPAIFNDEVIVPGLVTHGFSLPEALDYAQVGCVETYLPGKSAPWTDAYLNLAKCLELALNDGCDLLSGQRIGPPSGLPALFHSFDDLLAAFGRQVEAALCAMLAGKDEYDARLSEFAPEPLNSALIQDCLALGLDATGGGARYLLTGVYGVGLGTTTDSLAAIRALVFEQNSFSLAEMCDALKADFQGCQEIRDLCLYRTPKYGNDDLRADEIAVWIVSSFGDMVKAYSEGAWQACLQQNPLARRRAYHYAMLGSVLSHTSMGTLTGASANGRLAGETLSDGGSPSQGCNRSGATATLRSMAKPDYRLAPGGAALNLRLSPNQVTGPDGLERLADLLKAYFDLGGEQIQVNLLSADTLRRAMEDPFAYQDLVVRVAGFTAYFVSLPLDMQRELISRAEG